MAAEHPPSGPEDAAGGVAPRATSASRVDLRFALLITPVFLLLALAVYWPAFEGGWFSDDLWYVRGNPYVKQESLREVPSFQSLLRDMAGAWLEQFGAIPKPTESELFSLGTAHQVLGDEEAAARAYQRAFALGGPVGERVQQEMRRMEERRSRRGGDAALPSGRGRER
jgi:hypothetical protein